MVGRAPVLILLLHHCHSFSKRARESRRGDVPPRHFSFWMLLSYSQLLLLLLLITFTFAAPFEFTDCDDNHITTTAQKNDKKRDPQRL